MLLAAVFVAAENAMAFPKPAAIAVDGRPAGDRVEVCADGRVLVKGGEASSVTLGWKRAFGPDAQVFGDLWGHSRGNHHWARLGDHDSCKSQQGAMAWFFLVNEGERTDGYGVKVQPNAFACWRADTEGFSLTLDVRAGSEPVQLGTRTLEACTLVDIRGKPGETPFQVGRRFCRLMCPKGRAPSAPTYGFNDWYNTYGMNTATNLLADAAFWFGAMDAAAAKEGRTVRNRPYVVADDGWQEKGDWSRSNARWGLAMDEFAKRVRAMNAKPGLWYRPLYRRGAKNPTDPTAADVEERIRRDIARFRAWGMDLVKIDFLLYDWNGTFGFELADTPVKRTDLRWSRRDRTSAEVVLSLYRAMREAAGDKVAIIGCGALNHFCAGLFETNRTGDDTCGFYWPCVGSRGPCAVGMRAIQHGIFFAVDGDVVAWNDSSPVPIHRPIPWKQNRQWLDLLSRSGTSTFLSWNRRDAKEGDVDFIARALVRASEPQGVCEPLDWMTQSSPRKWRFGDETAEYDWEVPSANAYPFVPEEGAALQTKALQATIDRAASAGGGQVVIPKGEWTIGSVFFRPRTTLKLEEGAVLKGSADRRDYPEMTVRLEGMMRKGLASLVNADGVDGFAIEGPGTIDGNGLPFWLTAAKPRPRLVYVANAKDVTFRNVTIKNSPMWTCHFYRCENVYVSGCTIVSEVIKGNSPVNTDAIDLDVVDGAVVEGCYMNVNNDAVVLKGGKGPEANDFAKHPENGVCRNVLVEGCTFGRMCYGGVTLGSECVMASNVVLRNSRFEGAQSALYLKMRVDTPQLYTDITATNLSGTARQGLWVKPYLRHAKKEWAGLEIPSVATNVLYDAGPAFSSPRPEVIVPHRVYQLHRKSSGN